MQQGPWRQSPGLVGRGQWGQSRGNCSFSVYFFKKFFLLIIIIIIVIFTNRNTSLFHFYFLFHVIVLSFSF